jgi:hypothetical protein
MSTHSGSTASSTLCPTTGMSRSNTTHMTPIAPNGYTTPGTSTTQPKM